MNEVFQIVMQTFSLRLIVFILFGAIIGSFLNVVICRTPMIMKNEALLDVADYFPELVSEEKVLPYIKVTGFGGVSIAPCCNTQIKWYHNIPIFSWLIIKGRCRYCGSAVSSRYFWIELITATIFGTVGVLVNDVVSAIILVSIFCILIAISAIDLETMLIPDRLLFSLFVVQLLSFSLGEFAPDHTLPMGLLYAALVWGYLYIINVLCYRFTTNWPIGGGDAKLMALVGLSLGVITALEVLAFAIIINYIYCSVRNRKGIVPLGHYICVIFASYLVAFIVETRSLDERLIML